MNIQLANQKISPNLKKLPLTEYYNSLPDRRRPEKKGGNTPRMEFLIAISEVVERPVSSLRRWVAGTAQPAPLEKQAIAELLQCSVECLFPESNE